MYVLWSGSGVGVGGVIWKQRLICGLGSGIRPGVCRGHGSGLGSRSGEAAAFLENCSAVS